MKTRFETAKDEIFKQAEKLCPSSTVFAKIIICRDWKDLTNLPNHWSERDTFTKAWRDFIRLYLLEMQVDMDNIDKQIVELENKIAELKSTKERLEATSPDRRVAEFLHGTLCKYSHEDQCGWFYEIVADNEDRTWSNDCHARYLEKAQNMLLTADERTIYKLVSLI